MSKSPDDLLAFNDFENFGESPEISVNSPKKVTFSDGDKNEFFIVYKILTNDFNILEATPTAQTKVSMFQIEYYQQFFNIDTMEVVDRLASSMVPKRAPPSYLKTHLVRLLLEMSQTFNHS